jgi:CRISPR-associated protein Csy2
LYGVGVICHGFEAQVTQGGYTRSFALTRNPLLQDGSTAAIVEEGRVHLDITLVFDAEVDQRYTDDQARAALAADIGDVVAGMRIAGGSVMPPLSVKAAKQASRPDLILLSDHEQDKQFKHLSRRWLPGFALVSRDDVLQAHFEKLRETIPTTILLDAWLDLSRINHRATLHNDGTVTWEMDKRDGWLVPIPVGFAALTPTPHPAGTVAGARNPKVPFQFVESVYSMGQWISPHRLGTFEELMWRPTHDPALGLYRCVNGYNKPAAH